MTFPKAITAKSDQHIATLKDLWPFLRPYRGEMLLAFILLCIGSATILLVPLAFRDLIDFGFGEQQNNRANVLGSLSLNGHFLALFGLASLWAGRTGGSQFPNGNPAQPRAGGFDRHHYHGGDGNDYICPVDRR
jgi:ABC-type multidrug transport system fused ATPase/permease subunit